MSDPRDLLNKLNLCESEMEKLFLLEAYECIEGLIPQYKVLNYRIDFAIPNKMIAIEIDGHDYHKTKEQRTRDSQREREIKLALPMNWTVIRFTGSEIFQNPSSCVDEVMEFINKNLQLTRTWKSKGYALYNKGKYNEAIQAYNEAIKIDPNYARIWCYKGDVLCDIGRYKEAIEAYDESLRLEPSCALAWRGKGFALDKLDKHEDAIRANDESSRLELNFAEAKDRSDAFFNQGRYDKAIIAYDEALRIMPLAPMLWYNKAESLFHLGRYNEAIEAYDEALEDENSGLYWRGKGYALNKLGKQEEGRKCFNKADELDEDDKNFKNMWSFVDKGQALKIQGKYNEAIEAWDEAIRFDPQNIDAWFHKGNAFSEQGKHDEAIQAYDEAIRLNPKDANLWFNKGNPLRNQGKYDEAIKAYDEAIRLDPNLSSAWNNKGLALYDQGKFAEAERSFDKAIEINPRHACAWSNKGCVLERQGRYDEAIRACNEAIAIKPKLANAWSNKGEAFYRLGQYNEAILAYEEAIILDPNLILNWYNEGDISSNQKINDKDIFALGDTFTARVAFEYAKEFEHNNSISLEKSSIASSINQEDVKKKRWWQFWKQ